MTGAAKGALRLAAASLVLLALAALWHALPVGEWLAALRLWMLLLGWRGVLVFAAIYSWARSCWRPGRR